ncbi:hypothetical protein CDAR_569701 [Caerostris darwini]|uniref:Histone H4 n=1 Tax=Caerostris darwini TaxID=1538125 RepID=A0AAV4RYA4_9ARAC|nr:hypothetical protein CDAR_569701 [Caerostris darwini]
MPNHGKEGKGLGKRGPKRHRKVLPGEIQDTTVISIRRLARRGGGKRISNLSYEEPFVFSVNISCITYMDPNKEVQAAAWVVRCYEETDYPNFAWCRISKKNSKTLHS